MPPGTAARMGRAQAAPYVSLAACNVSAGPMQRPPHRSVPCNSAAPSPHTTRLAPPQLRRQEAGHHLHHRRAPRLPVDCGSRTQRDAQFHHAASSALSRIAGLVGLGASASSAAGGVEGSDALRVVAGLVSGQGIDASVALQAGEILPPDFDDLKVASNQLLCLVPLGWSNSSCYASMANLTESPAFKLVTSRLDRSGFPDLEFKCPW